MSILVVAGKARCSRAKAGRSAWLLPSRGEDPGQANSLGVDTWTLGSRPGRRGQYLPPQQPCYGSSMDLLCGAGLLISCKFVSSCLPACFSPFCIRTWAPSLEETLLFSCFVSFSMVVPHSLPGFEPWSSTYRP